MKLKVFLFWGCCCFCCCCFFVLFFVVVVVVVVLGEVGVGGNSQSHSYSVNVPCLYGHDNNHILWVSLAFN